MKPDIVLMPKKDNKKEYEEEIYGCKSEMY
jgi:hypothetical protein